MELFVCAWSKVVLRFAELYVVVIPAEFLAWLDSRKEFGFGDEEGYAGDCYFISITIHVE